MSGAKYDVAKVKRWLSEYRENEKDLEDQYERLERMQARLEDCSAPEITDMPRAPGFANDKLSLQLARKIDLENLLGISLTEHRLHLERIEYVIGKLPKAEERVIIRRFFEDGDRWDDICFILYGDKENYLESELSYKRNMYRLYNEALKDIAIYFAESEDPEISFFREYVPARM